MKQCPTAIQPTLMSIFTALTNTQLYPDEREFLKTGVLCPFEYADKQGKIRPVVILDTLMKMAWHIVLEGIVDPLVIDSTQTFGRPGSCQLAIHAVQEALHDEEVVIAMDAVNAYNTLDRREAMMYLAEHQHKYSRTFALVNMMYAEASTCTWFEDSFPLETFLVTTGTRQGCVSGLWFYTLGTLRANR
jgi:hypothetical protein